MNESDHQPAVLTGIAGGADEAVMLKVAIPTPLLGPEPATGNNTGTALAETASTPSNKFTNDCIQHSIVKSKQRKEKPCVGEAL